MHSEIKPRLNLRRSSFTRWYIFFIGHFTLSEFQYISIKIKLVAILVIKLAMIRHK